MLHRVLTAIANGFVQRRASSPVTNAGNTGHQRRAFIDRSACACRAARMRSADGPVLPAL